MHEKMFPHNWSSLDAFKPLFKTFSSSLTCSDTFISNVFQFVDWSKIFVFFLGYSDGHFSLDNCSSDNYPLWDSPRTLNHGLLPSGQLPLNNWPLDKYPPTNCSMKFSSAPPGNLSHGQLSLKSFPRDNYHRTTSPPEILHMTIAPWILLPDIFALLIPPWTTISRQLTPNEIPCGTSSHEHLPSLDNNPWIIYRWPLKKPLFTNSSLENN